MHAKLSLLIVGFLVAAAALPVGTAQLSTSAVVGNLVPVIQDVSVPSTVNPTAGGTTTVPVTITVSDSNGFQDIASVTVAVYKPDGSTVHIAASSATSNGDGSGVAETYSHSFAMQYHDDAAVDNDTYKVRATATDAKGAVSAVSESVFTYTELVAMSVDAASLDFGSMDPGTRSDVTSLAVSNKGNTMIDLDTSGTDLSDGNGHAMDVGRIKYDLIGSNMGNESALTSAAHTNTGFDLGYGPAMSKSTWWQLDVPSGEEQYLPAGSYSGTVTLSAVQG